MTVVKETQVSAIVYPDITTNYSMAMMCSMVNSMRACIGAAGHLENAD
jgi:hypothetical protein